MGKGSSTCSGSRVYRDGGRAAGDRGEDDAGGGGQLAWAVGVVSEVGGARRWRSHCAGWPSRKRGRPSNRRIAHGGQRERYIELAKRQYADSGCLPWPRSTCAATTVSPTAPVHRASAHRRCRAVEAPAGQAPYSASTAPTPAVVGPRGRSRASGRHVRTPWSQQRAAKCCPIAFIDDLASGKVLAASFFPRTDQRLPAGSNTEPEVKADEK